MQIYPVKHHFVLFLWTANESRENLSNNKVADQPVHPRSLISAFVIRLLESIIS